MKGKKIIVSSLIAATILYVAANRIISNSLKTHFKGPIGISTEQPLVLTHLNDNSSSSSESSGCGFFKEEKYKLFRENMDLRNSLDKVLAYDDSLKQKYASLIDKYNISQEENKGLRIELDKALTSKNNNIEYGALERLKVIHLEESIK